MSNKDFLQSLYEFLMANQNLRQIVGDKIYPMFIPQYDKIPAIVYYPVSANYDSALQRDTGFQRVIIQIDCHELTFKKARTLSRLIKTMFQDYQGDMFGTNIEAVFIRSDFILNNTSNNKFDATDSVHVLEFEFFIS